MLLTYSDKAFVSDEYNVELGRLTGRAVDLDKDHTDPAEVTSAWRGSVDDESLRLHDAKLIADLMNLQQDLTLWRDLAGLVLERVSLLLVVGDFPAAALLAEALRSQAESHREPDIRSEAAETLQNFLTPSTMRHVASHLDTSDRRVVEAARRFCVALGTIAIRPLAEVLSREERNRPRKHLIDVLTGFGADGAPGGGKPAAVSQRRRPPHGRAAAAGIRRAGGAARAGIAARRRRASRAARGDQGHRDTRDRLGLRHARPRPGARHGARAHVHPGRPLDAPARRRGAGVVASGRQGAVPRRDVGRARAGGRAPRRRRRPDRHRRAVRGASATQCLVAVPHAAPASPGHRRPGEDRQPRGHRRD
ncbi:MAG: hypothetical protein M0C28_18080 [Candidatus Moduliflexus flocculans]|nr:hypothetical protein [Candidatus Moduliflexus flocculans]